jgi:site-specific DNA recombinase
VRWQGAGGHCNSTTVRVDLLEQRIEELVAAEQLLAGSAADIRERVDAAVNDLLASDRETKVALRKQILKLEAQEARLLDLASDGALPSTQLKKRLESVALQRQVIEERLFVTSGRLTFAADQVRGYLDLLDQSADIYSGAPDDVRRELLQAFFTRLLVESSIDGIELGKSRTTPNETIHALEDEIQKDNAHASVARQTKIPRTNAGDLSFESNVAHMSLGLNKTTLVDPRRFELLTSSMRTRRATNCAKGP